MLAGEDETALGRRPASATSGPTSRAAASRRPSRRRPSSWPTPGRPTSACPTSDAADELVGDDMDAAEWAALDAPLPASRSPCRSPRRRRAEPRARRRPTAGTTPSGRTFEARLERLEAIQHQVVLTARAHEAARVKRKVVASTTGAGAAGLHPAAAAAGRRAEPLAPGGRHRDDRGRRARGAGRRLPHARPPARAPGRAGVGRRLAARRGAHRAAAGAAALAAAPGAPWARRAAPAVRSRLTAGRAPRARSAHPDAQQRQGLRLVLRRRLRGAC